MNPAAPTKMRTVPAQEPTRQAPHREPSDEEIRQRAYEIYLARGATPGRYELDDWLQAERELRSKLTHRQKRVQ